MTYSKMSFFSHVEITKGPKLVLFFFLDTQKDPWFWVAVEQPHARFELQLHSSELGTGRFHWSRLKLSVGGLDLVPVLLHVLVFRCFPSANIPLLTQESVAEVTCVTLMTVQACSLKKKKGKFALFSCLLLLVSLTHH